MTFTSTPDPDCPREAATPLTLTARSPEDLLALAPVVLGFHPTDSIVMLTFGAAAPFHARVDLPTSAAEVAETVDVLVAPARRHGVARVVILVYGTDRVMSRRLWTAVRDGFARAGIEVLDALRVEEERWYPLVGRDRRAQLSGVAYDVSAHPFLVQAVVDGRVTHGSRAALAGTLAADAGGVRRLTSLARSRPAAIDLLTEGAWIETTLTEHLAGDHLPDDPELARMLLALRDDRLRDAAWSTLSRERARAAVGWWTHALTRCPEDLVAAPAALLAWAAWLHGNGALAWCALDRCESVEPGYDLARLVADLLERAHPPTQWNEAIDWRSGLDEASRAG
ncbi:DUF4192 domain-containing protein [Nocardioides sp.]|uniref:DUF4192 domain-containing protein n=1 Tax=Nocardioides sp. TaxID=35761 RepID=UPI002B27974D|nr:DUF4192 domain-containing protein [Nocardioides sp.]